MSLEQAEKEGLDRRSALATVEMEEAEARLREAEVRKTNAEAELIEQQLSAKHEGSK